MDPASISALLSGGSSLVSGLSSLFGDDGSDAMKKALRQADDQFEDTKNTNRMVAGQQLALQDPFYQSNFRAYNNYLKELGQDYITSDLVGTNIQHQGENYVGMRPDGSTFFVNDLPQFSGGGAPPQTGGSLASMFGGQQSGGSGAPSGWNPDASMGSPVGTANGVTYYRRDQNSLMPYQWAEGSGQRGGPDLSAGAYQQSPGYGFQMDQGVQALDRSAAANGRLNSGRQAKELTRFGQGVANQDYYGWADRTQQKYDNWLSRLGQMAGQAPVAAGQVGGVYGGLGQAQAQNSGNLADLALSRGMTDAGTAQRSQSAFNGGMSNIFGGLGSLSTLFR